jgi:HTH-type transcriptional regulator, fmd operon transcriptional regulator
LTVKVKSGSLTKIQLEVLRLRMTGITQEEVANRLGTTRQNISLVERRAHRNLEKAEETITAYRRLRAVKSVTLPSMTHFVDVPRMLIDAADLAGVKISGDFSFVYKELRRNASSCISGTRITKPVRVDILSDGELFVEPE